MLLFIQIVRIYTHSHAHKHMHEYKHASICMHVYVDITLKVYDGFVELFLSKGLSDASAGIKSNLRMGCDIDIKLNQS